MMSTMMLTVLMTAIMMMMMMMMYCDVTVYAHPQQAAQTGDFFGGCLRSLRINGQLVDWHSAHELIDVHVSGCPIAEEDVYV